MNFSFFRKNKESEEDLTPPIRTVAFEELGKTAYAYLKEQMALTESTYNIGSYEKWFYDQRTGLLTFSNGGEKQIEIKYEEVGTISKISETWLWSWANQHIEDRVKTEILLVKEYGKNNNFEHLTKQKWKADQYDGWEMTAIAAYLMKAKGAYRVPTENTFSFMIFKEIIDLR